MGLDIVAYRNLIVDENASYNNGEGCYQIHIDIMNWSDNHLPLSDEVCYKINSSDDKYSFKAGSYSGYNQWRDWLCNIIHGISARELWDRIEEFKGTAFFELIYFSDCEGAIGSIASKKLYKDFLDNQEIVNIWAKHKTADPYAVWIVDYNVELYTKWLLAFKMASDNGAVCFY
jgi:hypothetical protein